MHNLKGWLSRFEALQGRTQYEEAWVLGAGPSLNALNREMLQGKLVVACNNAWVRLEELGCTDYIYVVCDKHRLREAISKARKPSTRICMVGNHERLVPAARECQAFGEGTIGLSQRTVSYVSSRPWMGRIFGSFRPFVARTVDKEWFCHDFGDGLNFGRTVVYTGIQVAHLLGVRVIRLMGVDARSSDGAYFAGMPKGARTDDLWLRNPRLTLEPNLALARAHLEAVGKRLIDCSRGAITSLEVEN